MAKASVRGYAVPIHQSLIKPLLMCGIPRDLFLLNGTFAMAFVMMKCYPLILINVVIHLIALSFAKKDAQFFEALKRHINDRKYYEVRA